MSPRYDPDLVVDGHEYVVVAIDRPDHPALFAPSDSFAAFIYAGEGTTEFAKAAIAERVIGRDGFGADYVLCGGAECDRWLKALRTMQGVPERQGRAVVVEGDCATGADLTSLAARYHQHVHGEFRKSLIVVYAARPETAPEVLADFRAGLAADEAT